MPRRCRNSSRGGVTIVELAVVLGLLGLVLGSVNSVLAAMASGYRSGSERQQLDADGARVIQHIVDGLRFADPDATVGLAETPFYGTSLEFRQSLGYQESSTGWSELQRLTYSAADATLSWTRETDDGDEGRVLRCEGVAALQAGEEANGLDDNGNGLIDEPGFCVTRDGDLVTVLLTLEATDHARHPIERSWSARIRCRN